MFRNSSYRFRKRCMDLVSFETRAEYEWVKERLGSTQFFWTSGHRVHRAHVYIASNVVIEQSLAAPSSSGHQVTEYIAHMSTLLPIESLYRAWQHPVLLDIRSQSTLPPVAYWYTYTL